MALNETFAKSTAPEAAEFAKQNLEGFMHFQSQLAKDIQALTHHWLERMQSEAALASEISSKMVAARSAPETVSACQQWFQRRMELATEDSQYALAEGQKLMQAGARLFPNGASAGPKAGST